MLIRQLGFRLQMRLIMPFLLSVEENDEDLGMHIHGEAKWWVTVLRQVKFWLEMPSWVTLSFDSMLTVEGVEWWPTCLFDWLAYRLKVRTRIPRPSVGLSGSKNLKNCLSYFHLWLMNSDCPSIWMKALGNMKAIHRILEARHTGPWAELLLLRPMNLSVLKNLIKWNDKIKKNIRHIS